MSNTLAIQAVTKALVNLFSNNLPGDPDPGAELAGTRITAMPPDKAHTENKNQLNVFLYQVSVNAAMRNLDPPQSRPGESAFPSLPVDLYYLLTVWGRGDDDSIAHRVLAKAMNILHDHTLLLPAEIKAALQLNDLDLQPERVRVTFQPLTVEEISKLWTAFQSNYRISVAYQVSVVLIDSKRAAVAPLPVLRRGPGSDDHPLVVTGLLPPYPEIFAVVPPKGQPSAQVGATINGNPVAGDVLTITGHDLGGTTVTALFDHPLLQGTPIGVVIPPSDRSPMRAIVPLPSLAADETGWPPGLYQVSLKVDDRVSNALPLMLAPRIVTLPAAPVVRDGSGNATIAITCAPPVWVGQSLSLVAGSRQASAPTPAAKTTALSFVVPGLAPGPLFLRLRVDGVDSLLVTYGTTPLAFDPRQKVTIA